MDFKIPFLTIFSCSPGCFFFFPPQSGDLATSLDVDNTAPLWPDAFHPPIFDWYPPLSVFGSFFLVLTLHFSPFAPPLLSLSFQSFFFFLLYFTLWYCPRSPLPTVPGGFTHHYLTCFDDFAAALSGKAFPLPFPPGCLRFFFQIQNFCPSCPAADISVPPSPNGFRLEATTPNPHARYAPPATHTHQRTAPRPAHKPPHTLLPPPNNTPTPHPPPRPPPPPPPRPPPHPPPPPPHSPPKKINNTPTPTHTTSKPTPPKHHHTPSPPPHPSHHTTHHTPPTTPPPPPPPTPNPPTTQHHPTTLP